ncbi:MAG: prepilin-type N-terminal cleavage/methylation domain-containing protein [Polyangiaceae bacterium]|nr:prepilin-type N-terminal cleavage/methylation domain-containing protein [Polyangiaceae bacterium]
MGAARVPGAQRGFTLLEVLVAVSILGLALTVILSSQVGLFTSAQHAGNLGIAGGLARCKMTEVELELLQTGYPAVDSTGSGDCCEGDESTRFACAWKVERVELPEPKGLDALGADGGLGGDQGLGALGALSALQAGGGQALGSGAGGISDLTSMLGAASSTGVQGMAPLVMSMVYPDLKPMLEESIRKVTVTVQWREGVTPRELGLVQYVTNPMQGGLDPNAAKGLDALEGAL